MNKTVFSSGICDCTARIFVGRGKLQKSTWQRWDSNPRPFGLVPKTSALDHSATLPPVKFKKKRSYVIKKYSEPN